jgi:hypothetical protein
LPAYAVDAATVRNNAVPTAIPAGRARIIDEP